MPATSLTPTPHSTPHPTLYTQTRNASPILHRKVPQAIDPKNPQVKLSKPPPNDANPPAPGTLTVTTSDGNTVLGEVTEVPASPSDPTNKPKIVRRLPEDDATATLTPLSDSSDAQHSLVRSDAKGFTTHSYEGYLPDLLPIMMRLS